MNYFQLFGIEQGFNIDLNALSAIYQKLQKAVHPDRFAHSSAQEQLVAVQKSSTINDAYHTLKDPLKRAEYLLKLRGTDMPSEQASFGDVSFLMRQMELREMLDEVKQAENIDDAMFAVSQIFESEFTEHLQQMEAQIAENKTASDVLACENLRKLKFYQKLQIELDRLEDLLFD
ncbi:co-chaperone HscB [Thalassotalea sp. PLHSN55]|uniref:co-chaperone HscB n=1 Tax=Thalassotalea sp. PLHSN55 TaxID=3435888 RepID=UPI003F852325